MSTSDVERDTPPAPDDEPPVPARFDRMPGVRFFRDRLYLLTGNEAITPLAILFLLYFFDEFDTGAFNTLAPNIKASFGLTNQEFGVIVVVNLAIVLLFAVPVGHVGDRVKRVLLVVIGAFIAGTFSFLTGVVVSVGLLLIVRIGNGVGRLVNDPIHNSLLSDWYQPFHRPKVFAAHQNAVQLGAIAGAALGGAIAALTGHWQWTFMLLAVPIIVVGVWAMKLKEPERGATDGLVNALPPLPFLAAVRVTLKIRTLRRGYLAATIVGAGIVPLAVLGPLFLDQAFGVGEFARGLIIAANSAATYFGVRHGGRWTQGWLVKGMGDPFRWAGILLIAVGLQLALLSASPNVYVYVVIALSASYTAGVFFPPLLTTQAFVAPARVRSLVFSFSSIFFAIGAGLFFVSPLGALSDNYGIRWGLFASAPFWVLGGLVAMSAAKFVTDDAAKAFAPD